MSDQPVSATPPGWYPDASGVLRYWDGSAWTAHVYSPAAPAEADRPAGLARLSVPQRVSAVSMLIVIVAAFLPWVSIFGISALGIEGDGAITLLLALVGSVVLVVSSGVIGSARTPGRASRITLLVLAVLVALIGVADMNGAAAIGLYLTMFAGVAWVVGAVWELVVTSSSTSAAGPAQTSR